MSRNTISQKKGGKMITTKQWGEHMLRLIRLDGCDLMLLDDFAQALEMNSEELITKIRDDFITIYYVQDDPSLEDGKHLFLTRDGVYQALLLAGTNEAIAFQDYVLTLIYTHNIGPALKSYFDFLDRFTPEALRKESK